MQRRNLHRANQNQVNEQCFCSGKAQDIEKKTIPRKTKKRPRIYGPLITGLLSNL